MKSKLFTTQLISGLLAVLFIFQSCISYKSTSITMAEAEQTKTKVLVKTIAKSELKFDRIEKSDSMYYGVKKGTAKVALKESEIASIHPYDKKTSNITTLILVAFPLAIIVYFATQDYAPDMGGFGSEE